MKEIGYEEYRKYLNLFNRLCSEQGDDSPDLLDNYDEELLKRKYRFLAKAYHPDFQPEQRKKQSQDLMQEINSAYDCLKKILKKEIRVIYPRKGNDSSSNQYERNASVQSFDKYKSQIESYINGLAKQIGNLDILINFLAEFIPHNKIDNKVSDVTYLSDSLVYAKHFKDTLSILIKCYFKTIGYSKTKESISRDFEALNAHIAEEACHLIETINLELKEKYKHFDLIQFDVDSLKEFNNFAEFVNKIKKYIIYVNAFDLAQILLVSNREKRKKSSQNGDLDNKNTMNTMITMFTKEVDKVSGSDTSYYEKFIKLWSSFRFLNDNDSFYKSYIEAMYHVVESKFYANFYSYDDELKKLYKELYFDLLEILSRFESGNFDISYLKMAYKIDFVDYEKDKDILLKLTGFSYVDDLKFFVDISEGETTCIYYAKSFGDKIITEKIDLMPFGSEIIEEVYSGNDFVRRFVPLKNFFTNGETLNKSIGTFSDHTFCSLAKLEYKGLVLCFIGDPAGRYIKFTKKDNLALTDDVYTICSLRILIDDEDCYKSILNILTTEVKVNDLDALIEKKKEELMGKRGGISFN